MQSHLSFYLLFRDGAPFEEVSLVEAGRNKSVNNVALYDGGWATAFCLDVLIRERTHHERGIMDLMRAMNNRFGKTGLRYLNEDIVAMANKTANEDLSGFFRDYVFGVKPLPLSDFLDRAGFTAVIGGMEVHLSPDPAASEDAHRIHEALLAVQPR